MTTMTEPVKRSRSKKGAAAAPPAPPPRRRPAGPHTQTLTLPTRGPFDLSAVARMGFGHRDEPDFDGVMRLAFCVDDDYASQVGAEVRQHDDELEVRVHGKADPEVVVHQVARVLSVDHDGAAFADLGRADEVVGRLQAAAPGFRPALFYSPYEAAVWAVLGARRSRAQGIRLRQRLIEAHGTFFDCAGVPTGALPTPAALLAVEGLGGLPAERVPRLHAIAEAARRLELSAAAMHALGPEAAEMKLQELPGIGPFFASQIVVRASGFADVPSLREAPSRQVLSRLYGLPEDYPDDAYAEFASRWAPFRTWVTVLAGTAGESIGPEGG